MIVEIRQIQRVCVLADSDGSCALRNIIAVNKKDYIFFNVPLASWYKKIE
jgi:hypothetical protein